MITKFYDPAVAESPAATPPPTEQPMSIAAMLAKHGVQNDGESPVATPIQIGVKQETPAAAPQPAPVEPTNQTTPAEPASPEPPKPAEEPKAAEPQKEPPPKVPTWQEVLKQQPDAKVILKELGFDDNLVGFVSDLKEVDPKMVAFFNNWKTGGDLTTYLKELTTDYSKMSAEDVMRHQLQQDYPKASKQQLDILFKAKVVNAYSLDSEDEAVKEEGKLLLEAEADRHRDTLMQKQQNFLFPKPPEPKAPAPDLQAQKQQQDFEAYQSGLYEHPVTKNMIANKKLVIGEGEEAFNIPLSDPQAILKILLDEDSYATSFFSKEIKPDGTEIWKPDVEKQLLIGAVLQDHKGFIREIGKHFKSLGGSAAIKPIENAKPPDNGTVSPSEIQPKTPAEAMARAGRLNSGGQ